MDFDKLCPIDTATEAEEKMCPSTRLINVNDITYLDVNVIDKYVK